MTDTHLVACFVVSPMTSADLDEVMEIEAAGHQTPWERGMFTEELVRDWSRLTVVREKLPGGATRVVAYCNYWLVVDEVHLLNIVTSPKHRQRGCATRLMEHLLDVARERKARCVTLEVRKSNRTAQRLYERFGFKVVGLRERYYTDNLEDALVMVRDESLNAP